MVNASFTPTNGAFYLNMKKVSYKGQKLIKPDNISMNLLKDLIDECGGDYSITVQSAINFISKKIKNNLLCQQQDKTQSFLN